MHKRHQQSYATTCPWSKASHKKKETPTKLDKDSDMYRSLSVNTFVPNYRSFDFFDPKFDHSSYSKIYAKYHFFCCSLLYQYKFSKNDLNLTMFG